MTKDENKKKFSLENLPDEMLLVLLIFVTFCTIVMMYSFINYHGQAAQKESQIRIEEKENFLLNEDHNEIEIKGVQWEVRRTPILSEQGSHDVFLVETSDDNVIRLNVYDSSINGKYLFTVRNE